jgi:hypothetical protein
MATMQQRSMINPAMQAARELLRGREFTTGALTPRLDRRGIGGESGEHSAERTVAGLCSLVARGTAPVIFPLGAQPGRAGTAVIRKSHDVTDGSSGTG